MADARAAILDRIRSAVGTQADPVADYAAVPRTYIRKGALDAAGRLRLFEERLKPTLIPCPGRSHRSCAGMIRRR